MGTSRNIKTRRSVSDRWLYGLELGVIGLLVILFFNLLSWPFVSVDRSLDGSWQAVLSYTLGHELRFGKEVIFTYGPIGSLSSFSYSGYNHAGKFAFEVFMRLSMVIFLYRFLINLRIILKLGCVLLYLFILQFLPDAYETYFFFGMFSWAAALLLERPGKNRKPIALLAVGVAFIVLCSLVKFTLFVAGVYSLGLVVASLLLQKRTGEALAISGGFILGTLSLWILLGQHLGDIPRYLYGSYQVARGYAMSMQLPMLEGAFKYFIFLLVSSLAIIAVVCREHLRGRIKFSRFKQPWAPLLVLYAGLFFMVWKQGVVRSDGHVWQFICYVPLASWFLYPAVKKQSSQLLFASLLMVQLLVMVAAMISFYPAFLGEVPERGWRNTRSGVQGFLKPSSSMNDLKDAMEKKGNDLVEQYSLLSKVGQRTVDVVGDHQALVILTRLNYQPRPVFQNYVSNNAYLQDLNMHYWNSSDNPEVVIQSLDAIDGTLSTQSDSQTILHLMSDYQWEQTSGIYVLLSKRRLHSAMDRGSASIHSLKLGEVTQLSRTSGAFQLAKFDVPLNLLGRLRAFFYKPPILRIKTVLSDGSVHDHRFNPVTSENDFLFAPSINSAAQLWEHRKGKPVPQVEALTIYPESGESVYFGSRPTLTITPVDWLDPS